MSQCRLGVQLYSVRESCKKDLPAAFKRIKEIGYSGVELYGGFLWSAEEVQKAAGDAGLTVIGSHVPFSAIDASQIYATIAYAKAVGMRYITVAMLHGEMCSDAAAWRDSAEKFNAAARILGRHGITLGYHNHAQEFRKEEGDATGWDIMMSGTDASVMGQIDNGNALEGGADALQYLQKYPGRAFTWHLKPYSLKTGFATMIGEDSIDWKAAFEEILAQGVTQWHIVEYDCPEKYPEMENIRRCYEAVRGMGY